MEDLSIGWAGALAYEHDWQQDISNLYKREEHASRVRAEVERKTQLYSNLLEQKTLTSPYNNARLQEFYKDRLPKIGQFISENPDFETDIGKFSEFNRKASELQDNDIIREELQVQKERELLLQNRHNMTEEDFITENERLMVYSNQSTTSPQKVEPYFFNNFLVVDVNQIIDKATASLGVLQYVDDSGTSIRTYDKNNLRKVAVDYYSDRKNRTAIDKAFVETGAKEEGIYNSPLEFLEAKIDARFDKSFIPTKTADSMAGSDKSEDFFLTPFYMKWNEVEAGNGNRPDPNAIFLTDFGGKGNTLSMETLNRTGKTLIMVDGQLKRFDMNLNFRSLEGEGGIVTDSAGKRYVAVSTVIYPDEANRLIIENNYSTVFKESVDPGLMNLNMHERRIRPMTGTIYVPLNVNQSTVHNYNRAFKTTEQLHKNITGRRVETALLMANNYLFKLQNSARTGRPTTVNTSHGPVRLTWEGASIKTDPSTGISTISTIEHGKQFSIQVDANGERIIGEDGKLKIKVRNIL